MIFNRLCLTLALALYSAAGTGEWRSVPADSRLRFTATYEGEALPGQFRRFDVRLRLVPERPDDGSLEVRVDLTSVEMGTEDLNEGVRRREWLDVARHQQAAFRSDRIRALGDGRFVADGALALKGRERPLRVPFHWYPDGGTARLTGQLTLERTDYGVGPRESGDPAIGVDVRVRYDVRLQRQAPSVE